MKYGCAKCEHRTEMRTSILEKEKGLKLTCQKCGSKKMKQLFSSVTVMVPSKGSKANKPSVPLQRPRPRCGCCH